ncbi:MAG: ABC transporter permease, partial [Chloroflexota bacterium]
MKHIIQQVFRSGKFVTGFSIFTTIILIVIFYPMIFTNPPLAIIGQGTFFPPGIYVIYTDI